MIVTARETSHMDPFGFGLSSVRFSAALETLATQIRSKELVTQSLRSESEPTHGAYLMTTYTFVTAHKIPGTSPEDAHGVTDLRGGAAAYEHPYDEGLSGEAIAETFEKLAVQVRRSELLPQSFMSTSRSAASDYSTTAYTFVVAAKIVN